MKPLPKRLIRWTAALLFVALAATFLWALSADKRGRWLHEAAWTNNLSRAKLLVWLGTDVNYSTGSGTALHGAAYQGNIPMMTFLLQHGAAVDQRAKFDITPLWEARLNKQSAAEQLLLAHGANPDTSHINPP
jgi:Ankyrin repeats (3 copies)